MRKTYIIELAFDTLDNRKFDVVKKSVLKASEQIMAVAGLLADSKPPKIKVSSEDFVLTNEEIKAGP